jgi:7-carboxy-7-deazaguanine synthase
MNQQRIEKRAKPGTPLQVHSIFYTIQGEGPFCGTPAVFIRLAGCNLQCPACDTDYTSRRANLAVSLILEEVRRLASRGLVVITGGEPFRQDISNLMRQLVHHGYYVQIETNGTLDCGDDPYCTIPDIRTGAYIVVSPKAGKVHLKTAEKACCFKYVMNSRDIDHTDGLPTRALEHPCTHLARPPKGYARPVYLQPQDDKDDYQNRLNVDAVLHSCMTHGYILQLQIHKLIGVE